MLKKLALLFLALGLAGQVDALELGGIVLGGNLDDAMTRYPSARCEAKTGDTVFDLKCGVTGQLAGKEVALVFQAKEGRVGSINAVFNPADYDAILHELTSHNGKPSKAADGFALWGDGTSKQLISLEKNSRNIPNSGLLMLMDLTYAKRGS